MEAREVAADSSIFAQIEGAASGPGGGGGGGGGVGGALLWWLGISFTQLSKQGREVKEETNKQTRTGH